MFEIDSGVVRGLMLERQKTIKQLASDAKITPVTAARLIRGGRANARTTGKLAAALGVNGERIIKKVR